jgi:uncharacterized phage protein (TIGR01671 family)
VKKIKFRAWNDISKEMLYHGKDIQGLIWWNEFGEIQSLAKAELMQSTGLKDKNGKEIYEGDILAAPHTYNIEIIYRNGSFLMKFFDDIGEKCEYHLNKELIEQDDLEIIGNKYDNPELEEMIGG